MGRVCRIATGVVAALALGAAVPSAALAQATAPAPAAPPYGSPVPVLDGNPFGLGGGLAPSVTSFHPDDAPTALATRVTGSFDAQVVVAQVDVATGAQVGGDVVVSDAGSAPAGAAAAVAAVRQPAVAQPLPATPAPGVAGPPGAAPGPALAPSDRSAWLVAWVARDGAGVRVVGRRVADDGTPLGEPLTLSEATYAEVGEVALAIEYPQRRALVAWRGALASDSGREQVVVQGWDPAAGRTAPDATRVSTLAGDAVGSLGLTFDFLGGVSRHLVVWRGTDPERIGGADEQEVLGRVLAPGGAPLGDVQRLSNVGTDGDGSARPADAAVNRERDGAAAAKWVVAWSQAPSGEAALRLLDADAQGPVARVVASAPGAGESIGSVAVAGLGGGVGLAYDVGTALGVRRVELIALQADGAPAGPPLALSAPGGDARLPLLAPTSTYCRALALWRSGSGPATFARFLWEPGCTAPSPAPGPAPPTQPRAPAPSRRAPRARTYGRLELRGVSLAPRRLVVGRSARLRFRVTAPATVVVAVERAARGRGARRQAQRLPRLRPAAATLRRVLAREPERVVLRVRARDGRGQALTPGRYRLVVRASSPDRRRVLVRRVAMTIVAR